MKSANKIGWFIDTLDPGGLGETINKVDVQRFTPSPLASLKVMINMSDIDNI